MELDPATTAVLALHWQHDIVSPEGRFAPTFSAEAARTGVVPRCANLLDVARRAGALIVYTRVCFRPGFPDLVANGPLLAGCRAAGALVDGEWGSQILDEVAPKMGDIVVDHRRISGFWGSTAFDAVNAGYDTTVVSDCCSAAEQAHHDVAVHTMEAIGSSTTCAEALTALEAT